MKAKTELKLIMKAKLQIALNSNVDSFFFALCCAMLVSISFTAKVLADDVLGAMNGAGEATVMMADGQVMLSAE